MLHSVSPFRLRALNDRLSHEITEIQSFGGAFPEPVDLDSNDDLLSCDSKESPVKKLPSELEEDSKKENREDEEETKDIVSTLLPTHVFGLNEGTPRQTSPRRRERSYSENIVTTTPIGLINAEAEESSHRLRPRIYSSKPLDDLDKRIRNSQLSIRDLSTAEYETYKQAGVTQFLSPKVMGSGSLDTSNSYASDHSSNSSVSLNSNSSMFQRRKIVSSLSLVVKSIVTPKETSYYHHMACYSHTWEIVGIGRVLQAMDEARCRVHFAGISAAASFNMVRKAKDSRPWNHSVRYRRVICTSAVCRFLIAIPGLSAHLLYGAMQTQHYFGSC